VEAPNVDAAAMEAAAMEAPATTADKLHGRRLIRRVCRHRRRRDRHDCRRGGNRPNKMHDNLLSCPPWR
jgi:hypothetical protein